MNGDAIASFLYLALLGSVIAGYFLLQNRHRLGAMAQQAAIWGLIFVGVAAAVALWDDIRGEPRAQAVLVGDGSRVEVPRARDGHFYLTLDLDGTPVQFIVDTGASEMVLTRDDAVRIGIDPDALTFTGRALTANGTVATARVWLDEVRLGDVVERDMPARVSGGEMPGSLLGMQYLSRFSSLTIEDGRMTLVR